MEVIAPFDPNFANAMVADLKAKVFPGRELHYLALGDGGRKEVKVV